MKGESIMLMTLLFIHIHVCSRPPFTASLEVIVECPIPKSGEHLLLTAHLTHKSCENCTARRRERPYDPSAAFPQARSPPDRGVYCVVLSRKGAHGGHIDRFARTKESSLPVLLIVVWAGIGAASGEIERGYSFHRDPSTLAPHGTR